MFFVTFPLVLLQQQESEMNLEMRKDGIARLGLFVRQLHAASVQSPKGVNNWLKQHAEYASGLFLYKQQIGMPSLHELVTAEFHPKLPLIMLNCSSNTDKLLRIHPEEGWTCALRMCRGIVFEVETGKLVAHPFPKFFALNEHSESMSDTLIEKMMEYHYDRYNSWYATELLSDRAGSIFEYHGKRYFTIDGTFDSSSTRLGTKILRWYERENDWKTNFAPNMTTLVALIHPSAKARISDRTKNTFVLLGAYNRETLADASILSDYVGGGHLDNRDWLPIHASKLKIKMGADVYQYSVHANASDNFQKLVASMKCDDALNRKNWTIRLFDGTRVALMCDSLTNSIVNRNLSPSYMMNRMMAGNIDQMLKTLDEQIISTAHETLGRIMRVQFMSRDLEARVQYLYGLVPPEASTAYYRGICRKFIEHLEEYWEGPVERMS